MYIRRRWLYLNGGMLVLNALLVCLTIFQRFPAFLPLAAIVVSMSGCILLAWKVNRPLVRQNAEEGKRA